MVSSCHYAPLLLIADGRYDHGLRAETKLLKGLPGLQPFPWHVDEPKSSRLWEAKKYSVHATDVMRSARRSQRHPDGSERHRARAKVADCVMGVWKHSSHKSNQRGRRMAKSWDEFTGLIASPMVGPSALEDMALPNASGRAGDVSSTCSAAPCHPPTMQSTLTPGEKSSSIQAPTTAAMHHEKICRPAKL
jgi:hypothetical protein